MRDPPDRRRAAMKPSLLAAAVIAALASLAVPAAGGASGSATATSIVFVDSIPKFGGARISIKARKPPSFRILLRAPTQGRTQLRLEGAHAPNGGPLLDTKTTGCEGAAGSFFCRGSFEPLPK